MPSIPIRKNYSVNYKSLPNDEAPDTQGWPQGESQLKLRRGGDTKQLLGAVRTPNISPASQPTKLQNTVADVVYDENTRGVYMHGGEKGNPWMDQPFIAPDVEPDSSTPLHENIHANQARHDGNRQWMPSGKEASRQKAYDHYIKKARTTFGEIDKTHDTSSDREANAYYGQQFRTAEQHKALLNEGYDNRGLYNRPGVTPYESHLANTEPGAYMLPRNPSMWEQLQDALTIERKQERDPRYPPTKAPR